MHELVSYIEHYGYLFIFLVVFLQELGVPNPVSNELTLSFCGYLSYLGHLELYKILIASVSADITGTTILFGVFYFLSSYLERHIPSWLPLRSKKIEKLKIRIQKTGRTGIFIGRLLPFIRGYVSVAAGILKINPTFFISTIIVSALLWSGGLVLAGNLIGGCCEALFHFGKYLH